MQIRNFTHVEITRRSKNTTFRAYILRFLKSLLFVAFAGGLLFGIARSISMGSIEGFIDGLPFGTVLAAVTVPLVFVIDLSQRFIFYMKYRVIDYGIEQRRTILLGNDYELVFDTICQVLHNDKNMEIISKSMNAGTISAVAGRSWRSFGENIYFKLSNSLDGRVSVDLVSTPKFLFTIIDYCKNLENVEKIIDRLADITASSSHEK